MFRICFDRQLVPKKSYDHGCPVVISRVDRSCNYFEDMVILDEVDVFVDVPLRCEGQHLYNKTGVDKKRSSDGRALA
ncbi:hypothetical protein TNCV_3032961 [Trichonephila clavipes]|nr:hypothetical protein TNCV_3032961 [Trichonephila clavipes]